jgi:hypothetical protein
MPELRSGSAFTQLFGTVARSARRLESRDRYGGDREPLQRWLAGEIDEPEPSGVRAAWLAQVRATTATGGRYERVRIVPEPPTDYQRFALRSCRQNVEAGEDIRYLRRERANQLDLPAHDFWLFDGERLALMYFTADDRLVGAHLIIQPAVVRQHEQWFELACAEATPYHDYLAEDPSREQPPSQP